MSGLANLLICMVFCLVAVLSIFIASKHHDHPMGLPGQLPPQFTERHPLLADAEDDLYHCATCARRGHVVAFEHASDLMIHEIEGQHVPLR